MAYGNQNNQQGNKFGNTAKPAAAVTAPAATNAVQKPDALFSTGLFAPTKPGVKSMGSVQLKEDLHLPAGSYINLYTNDKKTSDKSPAFRIVATVGTIRAK